MYHSDRIIRATALLHSIIDATTVMQMTGHKKVESIYELSPASLDKQIKMSYILSNNSSSDNDVKQHMRVRNTEQGYNYMY